MTDDLERYLYHSHQGWPVYGIQTSPSITGEAMKRYDLFAGYEQGQADMLAKCIAAVDGMVIDTVGDSAATVDQVLAALRALQEKP